MVQDLVGALLVLCVHTKIIARVELVLGSWSHAVTRQTATLSGVDRKNKEQALHHL